MNRALVTKAPLKKHQPDQSLRRGLSTRCIYGIPALAALIVSVPVVSLAATMDSSFTAEHLQTQMILSEPNDSSVDVFEFGTPDASVLSETELAAIEDTTLITAIAELYDSSREEAQARMMSEAILHHALRDANIEPDDSRVDIWISNSAKAALNIRTTDSSIQQQFMDIAKRAGMTLLIHDEPAIIPVRTASAYKHFEEVRLIIPDIQGFYVDAESGALIIDAFSSTEFLSIPANKKALPNMLSIAYSRGPDHRFFKLVAFWIDINVLGVKEYPSCENRFLCPETKVCPRRFSRGFLRFACRVKALLKNKNPKSKTVRFARLIKCNSFH